MSSTRAGAALLLLLAASPSAPVLAWTDATRTRMLDDAIKVSPPALRAILERYDRELGRGMLEPSRREGEEVHFQNTDDSRGLAIDAALQKEDEVRSLLNARRSFKRVTFELGVLAHLVSDIAFPLNASDKDPREPLYREPYRIYIGTMLARIPCVLEPPPSIDAVKQNPRAYLTAMAARAGRNYALIGPAFKDDGTPRAPDALDERSVPFGIASLSYSSAVNGIVRAWMHLWASVDGDMQGTIFLTQPPPKPVTLPARRARRGKALPAAPAPSPSVPPTAAPAPSTAAPAPSPAAPSSSPTPHPKSGRNL